LSPTTSLSLSTMYTLLLLLVLLPRPPTSTLFPYTTLFRSTRSASAAECYRRNTFRNGNIGIGRTGCDIVVIPKMLCCCHNPLDQDRKSTRLNSSHVSISYAVFCLKKKK